MKTLLNFSGISFEVGQSKIGLTESTLFARKYFHLLKESPLEFIDRGDCQIPNIEEKVSIHNNSDLSAIEWEKYQLAYLKTQRLLDNSYPLVNWGGDHSVSLATVGAFLQKFRNGFVVWIDAHADLNLPVHSDSGNFHGMPLAVLLNLKNIAHEYFPWLETYLDPQKLIYVGLRDIDPFEKDVIAELGIKIFLYEEIQKIGIKNIADEILGHVQGAPLHVSFDIDAVDPKLAPSTGVPVKGGLTALDLEVLGQELFKKSNVRSIDIVEINPALGNSKQIDKTYQVAFNFLNNVFNSNSHGETDDCNGQRNFYEQSSQIEWNF